MAGSYVSMFGSRITTIACPLLALYLTNSAVTAGLVAFAATVPSVIFYIPAGALVEHWDPRRTLLVCESGRGSVIAGVTLALATGTVNVYELAAAAFIEEILEVFSTLADQRFVRSMVSPDQASSAQASVEARAHAVVLAGRPVGAFLFSLAHILPFLADALSFVASVGTVARLASSKVAAVDTGKALPFRQLLERLKGDIGDGLKWLIKDRYARAAMTLSASTTLIGQALIMVFLAEANESLLSPVTVGLVLAASGGGGVIGSMVASRFPPPPKVSLILFQMPAWAVAFLILAVSDRLSFIYLGLIMATLSLFGALGNIEIGAHLIRNVNENMLARATSIGRLLAFSAYAVGPILGGVLLQWYGPKHAVVALFVITCFLAIVTCFSPSMWYREAFIPGADHSSKVPAFILRLSRVRSGSDLRAVEVGVDPAAHGGGDGVGVIVA